MSLEFHFSLPASDRCPYSCVSSGRPDPTTSLPVLFTVLRCSYFPVYQAILSCYNLLFLNTLFEPLHSLLLFTETFPWPVLSIHLRSFCHIHSWTQDKLSRALTASQNLSCWGPGSHHAAEPIVNFLNLTALSGSVAPERSSLLRHFRPGISYFPLAASPPRSPSLEHPFLPRRSVSGLCRAQASALLSLSSTLMPRVVFSRSMV